METKHENNKPISDELLIPSKDNTLIDLDAKEFLDRLKAGGVAAWNAYRQTELAKVDLCLKSSNFSSKDIPQDLTGIDLSRSIINMACFPDNVKLVNANLRYSEIKNFFMFTGDFSGADLRNADFSNEQIFRCSFANADLRNANFSFCFLAKYERDESGDKLCSIDLTGAQIDGLNVCDCRIVTEFGYFEKPVFTSEEFFSYAREAQMKIDGVVGNPVVSLNWEGLFKTYRPRY